MACPCIDEVGDFLNRIQEIDEVEKRPLELSDMLPFNSDLEPDEASKELHHAFFNVELPLAKQEKREPSMKWALFSLYKWELFWICSLRLMYEFLTIATPFVLREIVIWIAQKDDSNVTGVHQLRGYGLALALCLVVFFNLYTLARSVTAAFYMMQRIQASMMILIFEKVLRLRQDSVDKMGIGRLVTLHTTETLALRMNVFIGSVFSAPFALIGNILAMYFLLDWPGLVSAGVLLLFMGFQSFLTSQSMSYRSNYLRAAEIRLRRVTEAINGIKLIKLMNWEESFHKVITRLRQVETDSKSQMVAYRSFVLGLGHTIPQLLLLTVFGFTLLAFGKQTPEQVFPGVVILNSVRITVSSFSLNLNRFGDMLLSFGRFGDLLSQPERKSYVKKEYLFSEKKSHATSNDQHQQEEEEMTHKKPSLTSEYAISMTRPVRFGVITSSEMLKEAKKFSDNETALKEINATEAAVQDEEKENNNNNHNNTHSHIAGKIPIDADNPDSFFLPILDEMQIKLKKGTLTLIIGGAGKSLTVSSLVGDGAIPPNTTAASLAEDGTSLEDDSVVTLHEPVAISSQDPWIRNATVRENITMTDHAFIDLISSPLPIKKEIDIERYARALWVTQLVPDLETFPKGDLSELGESGILASLSGGQQARVSLCRAVYAATDCLVADDALSALDIHVAHALFRECFLKELAGKTRVLVTHQLEHLPHADRIIKFEKQRIVFDGSWQQYKAKYNDDESEADSYYSQRQNSSTTTFVKKKNEKSVDDDINNIEDDVDEETKKKKAANACSASAYQTFDEFFADVKKAFVENKEVGGANSPAKRQAASAASPPGEQQQQQQQTDPELGKLFVKEQSNVGPTTWDAYFYYSKAGGVGLAILVQAMFVLWRASITVSDMILSLWTNPNDTTFTNDEFMIVFAVFVVIAFVAIIGRTYFFKQWTNEASTNIHRALFERILRAPMHFFYVHPSGRIISRFSKDIEQVDVACPEEGIFATSILYNTAGLVITIMIASVYLIPLILILLFFYERARQRYTTGLRCARRLEDVTRSPAVSLLGEMLNGLRSVRVYGLEDVYKRRHTLAVRNLMQVSDSFRLIQYWILARMATVGAGIVAFMGVAVIVLRVVPALNEALIDKSFATLGLSYSCSAAINLSYCVATIAMLSVIMSSTERIKDYAETVPQEIDCVYSDESAEQIEKENNNEPTNNNNNNNNSNNNNPTLRVVPRPPANFPLNGEIEFKEVCMRYRPKLPLVLKKVTFKIQSRERCGILGRSGSSKSSLMQALFRLTEIDEGSITLSGIDIRDLTLNDLRKSITIIPQEPVLFSGTVKSNLDPFNLHSDDEIWKILEMVQMKNRFMKPSSTPKTSEVLQEDGEKPKQQQPPQENKEADILKDGLQTVISEGGKGLSNGERQLLIVARALLRRAKFLLLDECSSSLDNKSDEILQRVLRTCEEFKDCTILTIAHRLRTIADSDKILVMKDGEVAEFGAPAQLLENPESHYCKMAAKIGADNVRLMKEAALRRVKEREQQQEQ